MVKAAFLIHTLKGMRTEIITLCLNQIGSDMRCTKQVQIADGVGHRRNRDTAQDCLRTDLPQILFIGYDTFLKEAIQQEMRKIRLLFLCSGDII